MKENLEKQVVGVFLVILAILALVAVSAIRNTRRSIATSDWVNHTHAVNLEANAIVSGLHAGDSALREFVITGDQRIQAVYRTAYSEMLAHLEVGKALTRTEPLANQKFIQLEGLIARRVNFARAIVQARTTGGLEGATKALAADPDGNSIADVNNLVNKLTAEQNDLLKNRDKQASLQSQATRWGVFTGVGANFVMLAFAGWLIRDDLAARRRAARALQDANDQLENKVQERTAELVQTNQSLKEENLERRWSAQAVDHQLRYSQLIINSIGDLIFVVSRALNISRINPAVAHETLWDTQELVAQPLAKVLKFSTDGSGAQNRVLQALKEGREIQDAPVTLLCKDGKTVAAQFNLVPMRDQDKVIGGVLIVRVTEEGPTF